MYKLDLPIDLKEQAAIERRRRLEKERQSRIFNNKHRLIGVFNNFFLNFLIIIIFIYYFNLNLKIDKTALDQQVEDKKFMEEMERKRSEAFGI
jgi:hypothetical protein